MNLKRIFEYLVIGVGLDIGPSAVQPDVEVGSGRKVEPCTCGLSLFGAVCSTEELFPGAYRLIPFRKIKVL